MPVSQNIHLSTGSKRGLFAFLFRLITLFMIYPPLQNLFSSRSNNEYYSHIFLIPFVSAYLIYLKRKSILSSATYSIKAGVAVMISGFIFYGIGSSPTMVMLNQNDRSSLLIFSALLFWIGSFILLYGMKNFRETLFPFLFLGFMIPLPSVIMDKAIFLLQSGSTELVNVFFKLTGLAFIRENFVFHLPGISIEVARECSGIRSSMALLITGVLAAYLFLDTNWRRLLLLLSIFPLVILKNGIRILTLSLLAIYVDERILTHGFLHKSGGFAFYIPVLIILGLLLWILRKQEQKRSQKLINS